MAVKEFSSSWRAYGSGAQMRAWLRLEHPDPGPGTTAVNVTAILYIQTTSSISDSNNQNRLTGDIVAADDNKSVSHPYSGGGMTPVCMGIKSFPVVYGSSTTVNVTGTLSGYDIVSGSTSVPGNIVIPARPPSVPSAPGTPSAGTITGTSIAYSWSAPSQTNGASITTYQLVLSRYSDFRSFDYNNQANNRSRTASGLSPGTTYYARVRAHNAAGWGPWSGTRVVATKNYPSAPGTPSISGIEPQQATATWSAPSSNGGDAITNYQVQVSPNSNFSGASTYSTGTTRSRVLSGLTPGTTYYVRARAQNSVGYGGWSGARSFQTLSGAKILIGGTWRDGVAHIRSGSSWSLAITNKRSGGSWVL